jgi:CBS domain-containing protein/sporulation protein YlmC with PRC-barrel domain
MTLTMVNLSAIIRRPLVDEAGDRIGRIEDLVVRLGDQPHPPVVGLVVRIGGRDLFVPERKIASFAARPVQFTGSRVDLRRFERREGELLLGKDLLARHLINFVGGRLIRANDIILAEVDGTCEVIGVEPGRKPLSHTLFGHRGSPGVPRSGVVDFASIEPFVSHVPTAKLRIPYRKLAKLHPAQIADLVEAASHEEGEEIIEAVAENVELEADVFEELDLEHQVEFLESRNDQQAARLVDRMAPDEAADLITEVDQERRMAILVNLSEPQQSKVRNLLSYNPETAGGIMSPDFVAVPATVTAAGALDAVRHSAAPAETLNVVYVVDERGSLIGSAPIASLVRAIPSVGVTDIAREQPTHIHPTWDLLRTARQMSDFNLTVAPVVTPEHDRLLGVVTVDDLLEQILPHGWRKEFGMTKAEE